jgi:hypothetical protein
VFYLLTYAVMNIGAFAVVQLIARSGDRRTSIEDYRGIGFESPALAFSLSLFMLSLLGMPLTAGFMGKIMVFGSAIEQKYYVLVVIGVLNTAISAYYYLRLIIVMFFGERTMAWSAPRIPASVAAGAGNNRARRALPRNLPRPRDQRPANPHRISVIHSQMTQTQCNRVARNLPAKATPKIQEQLGETWLPRIYRERILKLRTARINSKARSRRAVVIQHTLLGVELKVGAPASVSGFGDRAGTSQSSRARL